MKTFGALIVLKILFFDIGVSLGDVVTDLLQGFFLIFNFADGKVKCDTIWPGIVVLIICWFPTNVISVIHIISHHK